MENYHAHVTVPWWCFACKYGRCKNEFCSEALLLPSTRRAQRFRITSCERTRTSSADWHSGNDHRPLGSSTNDSTEDKHAQNDEPYDASDHWRSRDFNSWLPVHR